MASGNTLFVDIDPRRSGGFARFVMPAGMGDRACVSSRSMVSTPCMQGGTFTVNEKECVSKLVVPKLVSANRVGRTMSYLVGTPSAADASGLCGPIVLTSRRADDVKIRMASTAVMALVAFANRSRKKA